MLLLDWITSFTCWSVIPFLDLLLSPWQVRLRQQVVRDHHDRAHPPQPLLHLLVQKLLRGLHGGASLKKPLLSCDWWTIKTSSACAIPVVWYWGGRSLMEFNNLYSLISRIWPFVTQSILCYSFSKPSQSHSPERKIHANAPTQNMVVNDWKYGSVSNQYQSTHCNVIKDVDLHR